MPILILDLNSHFILSHEIIVVKVANPMGLNQRKSAKSDIYKTEIKGALMGRRNKNMNIKQNKKSGDISEIVIKVIGDSEAIINIVPKKGKEAVIKIDL